MWALFFDPDFKWNIRRNLLLSSIGRAGGTGGAGGAKAPPMFLKIGEKLAFSTPNISRLVSNELQNVISTPNILHLPPGLNYAK